MRIVAISDAAAGNRRQAEALTAAVAARLGTSWEAQILQPRAPWCWLAPQRLPFVAHAFGAAFRRQLDAPPALAIGCGRQAALATRLLRAAGSRVVQILDPRIDPAHYDLVLAPAHDGLRGENVIRTLGSLNPIDDAWLAAARQRFAEFAQLPAPRIVLALGGPTRDWPFDQAAFEAMADALDALLTRSGGSLLLTTSRRSPDWLRAAARDRWADRAAMLYLGEASMPNPYPGFLAHADLIIATPDSANLLSEAASSGAPLLCPMQPQPRGKLNHLLDALSKRQLLFTLPDAAQIKSPTFDLPLLLQRPSKPLRETAGVADEVLRRLGFQGGDQRA